MSEMKTFILGIGAPKAGTTWAYAYLAAMPGASMGFSKEYHIWDATDIPNCARYRVPYDKPILSSEMLIRREMQRHSDAYFDYFASLLAAPSARFTADWTPSYMAIGPERLRQIYNGFAARGIAVKIVFLMRDPVARCYSMVRMLRERNLQVVPGLDLKRPISEVLADYVGSEDARTRTSYDVTLASLTLSGIPLRNVHVALYEELFNPDALSRMCTMLNVPFHPHLSEQRVNAARAPEMPPDEKVASKVAERFRSSYLAALRRLPQVADLWEGFRFLNLSKSESIKTSDIFLKETKV